MSDRPSISMQTIADRAGVSRMTVSRALRNDTRVAVPTREKIRRLADELGYKPNPLVSALMVRLRSSRTPSRSETLAFLTTHPEREGWRRVPTFRKFHAGAVQRAAELGFRVQEFWLREPGMTDGRMSRILHHRNIHGLLIAPTPEPGACLDLDWNRFASVSFGYTMRDPILHRVTNHQIHSIRTALQKVRERGYRRIGLAMQRSQNERVDHNWMAGFLTFQQFLSPQDRIPPLLPDTMTRDVFSDWFERHTPDIVMAGKHEIIDWLNDLGMSVPEDVGFVNLDKERTEGGASGIDQNCETIGAAAVELLAEQLYHNERGVPAIPKVLQIEGRWVPGTTVRVVHREPV